MLKRKALAYKSKVSGKYYARGTNEDLPELGRGITYYGNWGDGNRGNIVDLPKEDYPFVCVWSDEIDKQYLLKLLV